MESMELSKKIAEIKMKKLMAMLADKKTPPEPLTDVDIIVEDIPYIKKEGVVETRQVRYFLPTKAQQPMPVIFFAHYEMPEDSLELRRYLKEGWGVVSAYDVNKYDINPNLTGNDLIFNNAVFYSLCHDSRFDRDRIAVVGGSAGGYMSLMLNGLQLGICVSCAGSPITNVLFNFHYYFEKVQRYNIEAVAKLTPEEKADFRNVMLKTPFPFVTPIYNLFKGNEKNFPNEEDYERWQALSPVGVAEGFVNPLYITHFTSDLLVPLDQVTKKFTYSEGGETIPEGFPLRLPEFPLNLKYSLEELIPDDKKNLFTLPVPKVNETFEYPFDEKKQITIAIFDEGKVESYCSHNKGEEGGDSIDISYLKRYLAKGAKQTNLLTADKIAILLQRYVGKSIQLPAHTGIKDSIYGSLAIYKKEVMDSLIKWQEDNSKEELYQLFGEVIKKYPQYELALEEIKTQL